MTPGTYIRLRRLSDGVTRDDVALMIDSVPAISHRSRIELIAQVEDDTAPVSLASALVLADVLSIDLYVLGELVEAHAGRPGTIPRVCRVCACSDDNACTPPIGRCAWAEPDLCSACMRDAQPVAPPVAPLLISQGGEAAS